MPRGLTGTALLSGLAAAALLGAGCSAQEPNPPESESASASPSAAENWPQTVAEVESGVVRITAQGCEKDSDGTGFLVADNLVLTAGHVIEGTTAVRVDTGPGAVDAVILGIAPNSDVALLRIEDVSDGHVFVPAPADPVLADEVAALGYPIGLDLTFTQGRVSGLNRSVGTDTFEGQGFIQTDAAINPGNSGGPLIGVDGQVLGVVSAKVEWSDDLDVQRPIEGTAFAVPAGRAFELVDRWVRDDREVPLDVCEAPDTSVKLQVQADHPASSDIGRSLVAHGESINEGDYGSAFEIFTPAMAEKTGGLELWSQSLQTSFWRSLTIRDVSVDDGMAQVRVALRTEQDALDGFDGQTCSDWVIEYGMVRDSGRWLIDTVRGIGAPEPCAPTR